ncbi:pyridoxine/pyridoxamine 5'-phosphate oxidase [Salinicoccus sp. Marseille-QA3877]
MDIKKLIYKNPPLSGDYPEFKIEDAPGNPLDTFYEWFDQAVDAEVLEPSAFIFSTADAQGSPSARIVNLRDMDKEGFIIGSNSESRKGLDMENNKNVAMTFYWREVGRQIRVTGSVVIADEEENRADFINRNNTSKALSIIAKQSAELESLDELDREMQHAMELVENEKEAYKTWTIYKVKPEKMEFFQARKDLAHTRLEYEKIRGRWHKHLLWP